MAEKTRSLRRRASSGFAITCGRSMRSLAVRRIVALNCLTAATKKHRKCGVSSRIGLIVTSSPSRLMADLGIRPVQPGNGGSQMRPSRILLVLLFTMLVVGVAYVGQASESTGAKMARAADRFLAGLRPEQRHRAVFSFDDKERFNWHFIPL